MREYFEIFGFVIFTALGIAQLVAGYLGIELYFSNIATFFIIFLSIILRFTLPITIGAFFGAMNVWGWHWIFAGLFAVPGLLFMIPGALAGIFYLKKDQSK